MRCMLWADSNEPVHNDLRACKCTKEMLCQPNDSLGKSSACLLAMQPRRKPARRSVQMLFSPCIMFDGNADTHKLMTCFVLVMGNRPACKIKAAYRAFVTRLLPQQPPHLLTEHHQG